MNQNYCDLAIEALETILNEDEEDRRNGDCHYDNRHRHRLSQAIDFFSEISGMESEIQDAIRDGRI